MHVAGLFQVILQCMHYCTFVVKPLQNLPDLAIASNWQPLTAHALTTNQIKTTTSKYSRTGRLPPTLECLYTYAARTCGCALLLMQGPVAEASAHCLKCLSSMTLHCMAAAAPAPTALLGQLWRAPTIMTARPWTALAASPMLLLAMGRVEVRSMCLVA
jgi:hypothetical protein